MSFRVDDLKVRGKNERGLREGEKEGPDWMCVHDAKLTACTLSESVGMFVDDCMSRQMTINGAGIVQQMADSGFLCLFLSQPFFF